MNGRAVIDATAAGDHAAFSLAPEADAGREIQAISLTERVGRLADIWRTFAGVVRSLLRSAGDAPAGASVEHQASAPGFRLVPEFPMGKSSVLDVKPGLKAP